MNRTKELDEYFFENINNEKTAYFLGLMYSDGNVLKNKIWNSSLISLTQNVKNKELVYEFQKALKTNRKITFNKKYNAYTLSVNSNILFEDLEKWGVVPNKSLTLKFPTFISDDLMPHFIRGYFDGDGSIWDGKRKKMLVKNEKKPGTMRERIVHNVKFNFTGSETFIPDLQNYLIEHCGFTKTKLNYSKSKTEHKHCMLEYSGRKNVYKLYEYMYSNATIFSKIKKQKFNKIIEYEKS